MGELWIADISNFDHPDGSLPAGRGRRKVQFLGEIVSAASLLTVGEFQISSIGCRRRPKRRRCPGKIRLGREPETDQIHWACTLCNDKGVITNWKTTRWDLSPELKNGRIVSLSEARARRAGRVSTTSLPQRFYELDVDLIYAPVILEERVCRRIRLSGEHTLRDLHRVIHQAFDREEDEAYEFMFGPPYDPDTRRFVGTGHDQEEDEVPFEANDVHLDALNLKPNDSFGYLFDFSDEWVHRISVVSFREVRGRSVAPQVIKRWGESPPQLPSAGDPWDEDLFWNEVETTYPLTGLYGPYLAEEGVDADDWLGFDDLERHLLVMEAHTHSMPDNHPPVESMLLHAVVHVMAENVLAEKDNSMLARYRKHGMTRHLAIHHLGEDIIRQHMTTEDPSLSPAKKKRRKPRPTSS